MLFYNFYLPVIVLTVYRKRRVHKTVNLLTGKADINSDMVVSVMQPFFIARYSTVINNGWWACIHVNGVKYYAVDFWFSGIGKCVSPSLGIWNLLILRKDIGSLPGHYNCSFHVSFCSWHYFSASHFYQAGILHK